jgi:tRNA (cytidine/uridine-2'-O-)-methyltransferase
VRLALYQPDIPQNLGAAIRLAACFGVGLDVIEPCGFALTDRALKRAALDYGRLAELVRHASFGDFLGARAGRLVLIETDGATPLHKFAFLPDDCLILGRESAGASDELRAAAGAGVRIPMAPGARSLNVAAAGAIALAEALRQTGALAELDRTHAGG